MLGIVGRMIDYRIGDCRNILAELKEESINCCVTSPPYWNLRDYGTAGQIGLEATPEEYIETMVAVMEGVRRVLRKDGTLWLNIGDSYANSGMGGGGKHRRWGELIESGGLGRSRKPSIGLKKKDLVGIPWMLAFALRDAGWYLRQEIIWSKPNAMPESVQDRCTKSHETIFLLAKSADYYYDYDAIREPAVSVEDRPGGMERNKTYGYDSKYHTLEGHTLKKKTMGVPAGWDTGKGDHNRKRGRYSDERREMGGSGTSFLGHSGNTKADGTPICDGWRNKRSVWNVATTPFNDAHFAVYPPELIRPCIKAGCPAGGTVLDPFAGSGTTGMVAESEGRNAILIDISDEYMQLARKRTAQTSLLAPP